MITYWLYYGTRVVGAVRAPAGTPPREIRYRAIASHDRVPLCYGTGYAPFEWRYLISCAEVRT